MQDSNDNSMDFGAMLDRQMGRLKTTFSVGDKVSGVVTRIGRNTIFVDIGSRSDGILDRMELVDDEGNVSVKIGDTVSAFCVARTDDGVKLTTRMSGKVADASLEDAHFSGIPIEGRVAEERKGGYEIQITGGRKAFCPYSQIDVFRRDASTYIGERFTFLITEYGEDGRNIVLSRRRLLEQERAAQREQLQQTLEPGMILDGTVTKIMPFGVFVDLGGVEGLVPGRELGWGRDIKAEDILAEGQAVQVKVLELDWERDRISLSLRQAQDDPWDALADSMTYVVGTRHRGVVTRLAPFGAFVELEPGIEGLVHISRLGAGRRIGHPQEVLKEGDEVDVSLVSVDLEKRRMALSMDDSSEYEDEEAPGEAPAPGTIAVGATVSGTVDGIRPFGVFVSLPGGRSGLLHISQVTLKGSSNPVRALHDTYPPGSTVEVVIREISGDRISLTLQETLNRESENADLSSFRDGSGGDFGSLGDLLGNLKL